MSVNINTATLEELKSIRGISDKRANIILNRRKEKGTLTLAELRMMTDIPSTLWDPLVSTGELSFGEVTKEHEASPTLTTTKTDERILKLEDTIGHLRAELQRQEREKEDREEYFKKQFEDMKLHFEEKIEQQQQGHDEEREQYERKTREEEERFLKREAQLEEVIRQSEIHLRQVEQKHQIESTVTKIENISPGGIYSNSIDTKDTVYRREPFKSRTLDRPADTNERLLFSRGDGPLPPKLSTYDGKSDWRPYHLQFTHIMSRYNWTDKQCLDKLIECLRDKALKYFSSRPKPVQQSYQQLCKKMDERFGRKDLPHIIRKELQSAHQQNEESLEEFAERVQELATDGYPDTTDEFIQIVATDAFLKGCLDKKSALTAMDKDPANLDSALQLVKSAVSNQKVILGTRKTEIKRVSFIDNERENQVEDNPVVRTMYRQKEKEHPSIDMETLDKRLKKTEEGLLETKNAVKEILNILRESRSRSPNRNFSTRQSPTRGQVICYRCKEEGHFSKDCQNQRGGSPRRYLDNRTSSSTPLSYRSRSPSPLNWQGLKK